MADFMRDWRYARSKAFERTVKWIFGSLSHGFVTFGLTSVLVLVVLWIGWGKDVAVEEVRYAVATIVAILGAFGLVFIINLVNVVWKTNFDTLPDEFRELSIVPPGGWDIQKSSKSQETETGVPITQLNPSLRLSFGNTGEYISQTTDSSTETGESYPAKYVKIKVEAATNTPVKGCFGKLTNVRKRDSYGKFQNTVFTESLKLHWSGIGFDPIKIYPDDPTYLGVFKVNTKNNRIEVRSDISLNRYKNLFGAPGEYELSVRVYSDAGINASCILLLEWSGDFHTFTVSQTSQ